MNLAEAAHALDNQHGTPELVRPSTLCLVFASEAYFVSLICEHDYIVFRCAADVVAGIVAKVLNARAKSRQLGVDICLMYIEVERQDIVVVRCIFVLPVAGYMLSIFCLFPCECKPGLLSQAGNRDLKGECK